jgi:hypothetical protein
MQKEWHTATKPLKKISSKENLAEIGEKRKKNPRKCTGGGFLEMDFESYLAF